MGRKKKWREERTEGPQMNPRSKWESSLNLFSKQKIRKILTGKMYFQILQIEMKEKNEQKKIPRMIRKAQLGKKLSQGKKKIITSNDLFWLVLSKLVNSLPSKTQHHPQTIKSFPKNQVDCKVSFFSSTNCASLKQKSGDLVLARLAIWTRAYQVLSILFKKLKKHTPLTGY